jgi:hypothetical protein
LDSSALTAFDLKLSYSRSMAAVQTYASNAGVPAEPASAKPVEPVQLPAETQAPAPAPPAAAVKPAEDAATTDPVTPPAAEGTATTAAAATTAAKAASARETITSFAEDILERLDNDDESDAAKFSLRWKVEFLIKGFGSVALSPVEQAAADALGIALDAELPA